MKVRMNADNASRFKRTFPHATLIKINENEYTIDGVDAKAIAGFGQILQDAAAQPQQEQAQQQQAKIATVEKKDTMDIAAAMKILITSTIQPLLEDTKNDVKKEILDEINSQVATISSTVEELIKKTEKETIDLARQVDEISNKLATIKNLNEDEQSKILEKLAKMNQYLRDIPKI